MKRANGSGTIIKLTGNRRRPWAIRRVIGWKENGQPQIKYQGYYRTRREAETALNEYNADPYTLSKKTFEDVYEKWYATRENVKAEGTLKGYRVAFGHLQPLHDMYIKDIDRNVLQRYYDDIKVSAHTLKGIMQLINMVFEYAVKSNILPISALNINKVVNVPIKEQKFKQSRGIIEKKDINRLWALKDRNEYAKIALVYIYTGLRFSELRDLDPEKCFDDHIEITHAKTPSGVRVVPICDKLKGVLPIIKVPPRTTFERHFRALLPNHYIHETRHTFITMMTEAGVDKRIIKAIVGHKSNDITDAYTHITLDTMLEAVNRL